MTSDLHSKCRICLNQLTIYYHIFDNVEENYKIIDMLDSLVPQIKIKTSQFSTLVCQLCVDKLLNAYKFQQLCLETNDRLNILFGITLLRTHLDLENILNPLSTQANIIQAEVGDYAFLISELPSEKFNDERRSDNERMPSEDCESGDDLSILPDLGNESSTNLEHQPFQCRYCFKSFEKQKSLSTHYEFHRMKRFGQIKNSHENSNNEPSTSKSENRTVENTNITDNSSIACISKKRKKSGYCCEKCGLIFTHYRNLCRHRLVHSVNKLYECEICKRRFDEVSQYKFHFLNHRIKNEENKYSQSLSEALKAMKQRAHLVANQQLDAKYHKCNYCSSVFNKCATLEAHIRKFHNIRMSMHTKIQKELFVEGNFNRNSDTVISTTKSPDFEFQLIDTDFESELPSTAIKSLSDPFLDNVNEDNLGCSENSNNEPSTSKSEVKTANEDLTDNSSIASKGKKIKILYYPCEKSGQTYPCHRDLIRHSSVHSLDKSYECEICKRRFDDVSRYKIHFLNHRIESEENEYCESVPEAFKAMKQRAHLFSNQQLDVKYHKCNYCSCVYKIRDNLEIHIKTFHNIPINLHTKIQEELCAEGNRNSNSDTIGSITNPADFEFQSPDISLESALPSNKMKTNNDHFLNNAGENNLVTSENSNNEQSTSKGEARTAENIDLTDDISVAYKMKNRVFLKYPCEMCGKIFNFDCNLKQHLSVHSLDNPYECEICKYRFSKISQYKKHFVKHRIESDINTYCQSLPEAVRAMKQLAHVVPKEQLDAEYLKCNYCRGVFKMRATLQLHIRKFHNIHMGRHTKIQEKFNSDESFNCNSDTIDSSAKPPGLEIDIETELPSEAMKTN